MPYNRNSKKGMEIPVFKGEDITSPSNLQQEDTQERISTPIHNVIPNREVTEENGSMKSYKLNMMRTSYKGNESDIKDLVGELKKIYVKGNSRGRSKISTFTQNSNPRLFVVRFGDCCKLENESDKRAALAFKNAIHDEVILLGLTRLPPHIQDSYK